MNRFLVVLAMLIAGLVAAPSALAAANVSGRLFSDRDNDGVYDAGEKLLANQKVDISSPFYSDEVTTDVNGQYTFMNVPDGDMTITPADIPEASAAVPRAVKVAGAALTGIDFGRRFPTLSGTVTEDFTGAPVSNATVSLSLGGKNPQLVQTGPDGAYFFYDMPADVTGNALVVTPPAGTTEATSVAGNRGGTVGPGYVVGIPVVGRADTLTGYNLRVRRAEVRGTVCVDVNENGTCDAGEPPLGGADVFSGTTHVTTKADGTYFIGNRPTGTIIVTANPSGYKTTGVVLNVASPQDQFTQDFAARGATLAGTVADDFGYPVAGATVTLGGTASATTQSAADGTFSFHGLAGGAGNGYSLTETQPTAYGPGSAMPGNSGGSADGANAITGIAPAIAGSGTGYSFVETTATIDGAVISDLNHNGVADPGEPGVAGATAAIADTSFTTVRKTNGIGHFTLDGLVPGNRTVTLTVPSGYTAVGSATKTVAVAAGVTNPVAFLVAPDAQPTPVPTATATATATASATATSTPAATVTPTTTATATPAVTLTPSPTAETRKPVVSASAFVVAGARVRLEDKRLAIGCGVDAGAVRACTLIVRKGKRTLTHGVTRGDGFRTVTAGLKLTHAGRKALGGGKGVGAIVDVAVTPESGGAALKATKRVRLRPARQPVSRSALMF